MEPVDVTWQPEAESLAEGHRVYRQTPSGHRSRWFGYSVGGVVLLAILVLAFSSGHLIGFFIVALAVLYLVRRSRTSSDPDQRWASAVMSNPDSKHPQRLELSESSVIFHLGGIVSSWVWSEIVAVHESPHTFVFITPGSSQGVGANRVNAILSAVVIVPRKNLTEADEQRLRAIVSAKNKLIRDDAPPAAPPPGPQA